MTKKRKLKKQVYYVLFIFIILVVAIVFGLKKYQEYKYHQTYEYKLLEHGYLIDEVDIILKEFTNEKDLNYFLEEDKNSNFVKLTQEKYYLSKNFYNYIAYMGEKKIDDLSIVVRDINVHLNNEFYETTYSADINLDTKMLVNKYYVLDAEYEPNDLVNISQSYSWGDLGSQKIRKVVYDAFLEMWNAAYNEGYYLMVNSAYRSYQDQESVYNNYQKSRGQKYADSIAARPGSSEHQTGLTLDIFSKNNSNKTTFETSEEAKWLSENSYKYGFILRYPEDKVEITGYAYEAWHFRYVGTDIATYIYNNNITFEEYYAYFIEK